MSADERRYETRYCAFLDILGFSDLIGNIGKDGFSFEVVRDLLRKIHQPSKFDTAGTADFRATTISDAIALSSSFSANGLAVLVDTICRLVLGALEEGYFMRGGLCRGLHSARRSSKRIGSNLALRATRGSWSRSKCTTRR